MNACTQYPGAAPYVPADGSYANPINVWNSALGTYIGSLMELLEISGDPLFNQRAMCVGMFDDSPFGRNAVAIQTDTILFGWNLFQHLAMTLPADRASAAMIVIMSHEFGHTMQNAHDLAFPGPTVKIKELHADCLGGYLTGLIASNGPTALGHQLSEQMVHQAVTLGDDNHHDYNHHGTSLERATAALVGFRAGQMMGPYANIGGIQSITMIEECNKSYMPLPSPSIGLPW